MDQVQDDDAMLSAEEKAFDDAIFAAEEKVFDDARELSIGELAKRTGLSVKLIRHWSDLGIVPPSGRDSAGYRRFDARSVARLELARTLRQLGLGMTAIRAVVDREHSLAQAAALHANALETQIRTLRLQLAVLRSVARAAVGTDTDTDTQPGDTTADTEELAVMTKLAYLSAAERNAIIHDFVTTTLDGLDVPTYRQGLLAATPDLPADPTAAQVDAWLELASLVRTPGLRQAMRRMAEYAATHAPGEHDEREVAATKELTDLWRNRVDDAMAGGISPDSPAADPVVVGIVEAWIPSQNRADPAIAQDGEAARRLLLEQLALAAEPDVERYWRLVCVINGWPDPPDLRAAGAWLMTALRANPAPGARAAAIATMVDTTDEPDHTRILEDCARLLAEVATLVERVRPDQFNDPTPCADWDVRALLNHLVYENLMWTSLATGTPRSDFAADHLGDDHVTAFQDAARATMAAFGQPGLLRRQFGPAPGWRMVEQVIIEMLAHGWDLARATGQPTDLAPDIAAATLSAVQQIYGDLPRTSGGSFAPAAAAPANATAADRFAAYLGRALNWPVPI